MTGRSWLMTCCPYINILTVFAALTRFIRLMPDSRKLGKEKEGEIQLQNSEKKYNTQDTLLRKTAKP